MSGRRLMMAGGSQTFSTYSAWNPSDKSANITLSNSDYTAKRSASGAHAVVRCLSGKTSGKWYVEFILADSLTSVTRTFCGFAHEDLRLDGYYPGIGVAGNEGIGLGITLANTTTDEWYYYSGIGQQAVSLGTGLSHAAGIYWRVAADLDNGDAWLAHSDAPTSWIGGGDPATLTTPTVSDSDWVGATIHKAMSDRDQKGYTIDSTPANSPPTGFNPWGEPDP